MTSGVPLRPTAYDRVLALRSPSGQGLLVDTFFLGFALCGFPFCLDTTLCGFLFSPQAFLIPWIEFG